MRWLIMTGVLVVLAALAGVVIVLNRKRKRKEGIRRWEEKWARRQREYEEQSAELDRLSSEERHYRVDENYRQLVARRQKRKRFDAIRERRVEAATAAQGGETDTDTAAK